MPSLDGGECYLCWSAYGEPLHLWLKPLPDRGVWAWLEGTSLEPVVFTGAEADQLLTLWRDLRRKQRAGVVTDQQWCVVATGEESGTRTALVYGLEHGHVTYWRVGEPRDPVPLDLNAIGELIKAWDEVRGKEPWRPPA
ncbi:hypothetical protein [Saccharothrix australiensis]|uniref:Uncharacterized protein n=1 Tax=Saccharothrix australiensis TaxID=2072 RepID=A0A495VWJ9_9PSEU|nr:hypothetical protein [Saccharothrix australiensis]RKT52058.1 hypothetical protein C8E97_0556 [Saccharothrix australiensis]